MWRAVLRHAKSWLGRKRNPLLRDPVYAGFVALEDHMRSKHMNASAARRAKTDRLNELLQRPGAPPVSRAAILNIIGA